MWWNSEKFDSTYARISFNSVELSAVGNRRKQQYSEIILFISTAWEQLHLFKKMFSLPIKVFFSATIINYTIRTYVEKYNITNNCHKTHQVMHSC